MDNKAKFSVVYTCKCGEEIKICESRTTILFKITCENCGYKDRIEIKEEKCTSQDLKNQA